MFLMHNVTGNYPNCNWFSKDYILRSYLFPEPDEGSDDGGVSQAFQKTVDQLPFKEKLNNIGGLPVYELAAVTSKGQPVEKVVAPYMITAIPNTELQHVSSDAEDFRLRLSRIPVGTKVYTLLAWESAEGADEPIGELVTATQFVASRFGDKNVFFQQPHLPWKPT